MNFVATDLGASGTRYVSDSGKIKTLPNNMVIINTGSVTPLESYADDIESNLELTVEKEGESKYFPCSFLVGKMAERYSPSFLTPDINKHKHAQQVNYLSAIMSVAVSKIKFGLDEDILLVMDVPPIEIVESRKVFKSELVGKYKVTFPKYMGGTTVTFNIVDVAVYEESVMAMASFFFNMTGTIKEENKEFIRGKVLSLDIGASTSDLAVISDGKFLDMTGRTIKTGGNVARGSFINLITAQEGYELPEADAEKAIAEGRIAVGNGFKDVGDLVNQAKRDLAAQIISPLNTYFREIKIPIQQIRAIIVSGGGSMAGQYVNSDGEVVITSEPLSKYVTEALRSICDGVEAIPYGEDARMANVKGLFIRAKVLMQKMQVKIDNIPTPKASAPQASAPQANVNVAPQANVNVAPQANVNVAPQAPTQAPVNVTPQVEVPTPVQTQTAVETPVQTVEVPVTPTI